MSQQLTFGIVGGSGMLGRAIARGLLDGRAVAPENLWISNRSGRLSGFDDHPGVTVTDDNQALAEACEAILLCVPPAAAGDIGLKAPGRLVLSVMAGVSLERLRALTGADRVVRAMSSPAAADRLAYSPWVASRDVTAADRRTLDRIFGALGRADEVLDETQIEVFTAITGPVPGFVAFFADCMARYATERGVADDVADRAVRQLFLAAGRMMAEGAAAPRDHVREMIDYDGTTAGGLLAMQSSPIAEAVAGALDAAVARTRTIGQDHASKEGA